MSRLPRIVVPGVAHHLIQRGARRQRTFFSADDYRAYLDLAAEWCARAEVAIWAYCLMPNHVHFIVVPSDEDGLRRAFAEAHRRYARLVNAREGWTGHFWQARFSSTAMDTAHLLRAVRYVERNPVRAGLVERPEDWRWSSAPAHLGQCEDVLLRDGPLRLLVANTGVGWRDFLAVDNGVTAEDTLRLHARTGRPLGDAGFISELEARLGRSLALGKPGPKPKG